MGADARLRACLFLGVVAVPQLVARRVGTVEAEGLDNGAHPDPQLG
jgi:hypothetical protein